MKNRIVVIGCGNVGMSYIYALVNQVSPVDEIVLIDQNISRVEGEAMDLNHSLSYSPNTVQIRLGDYSDCKDAAIVCITAGISQTLGSRLDDLDQNIKIFQSILGQVKWSGFSGIFLIASNPLDVMTYYTYRYMEYPSSKVIGTGTSLDTSRLVYLISNKLNVSPKSIEAYVIGEHGDTQFVPWSNASIALQGMDQFLTSEEESGLEKEVRDAAYEIVKRKGATYYGIGMSLARITIAILKDEKLVLPVSNYDQENDIYISTPCVIGRSGIERRIYMQLSSSEEEKLVQSIQVLKEAIANIFIEE